MHVAEVGVRRGRDVLDPDHAPLTEKAGSELSSSSSWAPPDAFKESAECRRPERQFGQTKRGGATSSEGQEGVTPPPTPGQ